LTLKRKRAKTKNNKNTYTLETTNVKKKKAPKKKTIENLVHYYGRITR
jgi:hypothetical protein